MTGGPGSTTVASRVLGPLARRVVTPRTLALLSGLALIGTFLGVFYHLVDVVGGVAPLVGVVAVAFVLSTAFARFLPPRVALGLGSAMLLGGALLYVVLVPEHHDRVLTVEFLVDFGAYLTGITVLQFLRVDLWAVTIAPGPTFLTWYLLLRRRYDLGALVGGSMLGFFVLTGDAGWTTTVVGATSTLAVLGFGTLELADGTAEHVERLGGVFVGGVLAARVLRDVDWGRGATGGGNGAGGSGGSGAAGGAAGSGGSGGGATLEGSLTDADGRVDVVGAVGLSPAVRFSVTADQAAYWHAAAFDRYTGEGWVRSGDSGPYDGPLEPPDAETTTVEQTFRVESPIRLMPAAWKPVEVRGGPSEGVRVTSAGGLVPAASLREGGTYTVRSEVPAIDAERLRAAGTDYPPGVRERYLQLPESTPERIARRARDVAGGAATPYDAARAVGRWLQTNKGYSLDVDRPAGDVVDGFLFGMDRGYCVYFATAMAVLLRSLGVPARFANGYTPGEHVAGDRFVVRGLDSHAWTEVYFPGVGWVPFDPTPAEPRRAAERSALDSARVEGVEGVDTEATRERIDAATPAPANASTVITPDPLAAVEENRSVGATPTPGVEEPTAGTDGSPGSNATAAGADLLPDWGPPDALAGVDRVTLVATLVGGFLGIRRLRLVEHGRRTLRLRYQSATDSPAADVERAFERLELLLSRRRRPREPGETPRQYVEAVGPAGDRRASRVVELYERAAYSGTASREEADEAIRCVDELVAEGRTDRPR
jgi:transglutaminase-like putative cysteine protease